MAHVRMESRDNDEDVDSGKDTEPSSCKSDVALSSSKPWDIRNSKFKQRRRDRAAQHQRELKAQGLLARAARNIPNAQNICFAGTPWSGRENDLITTDQDAERLKRMHEQSLKAMGRISL